MITGTLFFTWTKGRQVGKDSFGNRYYEERSAPAGRRAKRWVMYKGALEPSKVPAEWHAWLHYTTDKPIDRPTQTWEHPHVPNLSGTTHAYLPPGHDLRGGQRSAATGDYQPWTPA